MDRAALLAEIRAAEVAEEAAFSRGDQPRFIVEAAFVVAANRLFLAMGEHEVALAKYERAKAKRDAFAQEHGATS